LNASPLPKFKKIIISLPPPTPNLTEKIGSFEHFAKPDTEIGLIH